MLPNIDPTVAAGTGAATPQPQVRRPELEQALEAYNTPPVVPDAIVQAGAGEMRKTDAASSVNRHAETKTRSFYKNGQDQSEINFQLTREERDVFVNAISGDEDPEEMSEQEQETLQRVAERIEKLIEEAATRNTQKVERLEKAIKEWYTRLSGKREAPADLIALIYRAAAGLELRE